MKRKGFTETLATTLLNIISVIVFILTVFFIFEYFLSYSQSVGLHEMDRKMDDYSEKMLTNCSLLSTEGIFNATRLMNANGSIDEKCFRYCELGTYVIVTDMKTEEKWSFGYYGERNKETRSSSFYVGILNDSDSVNNLHQGKIDITIFNDLAGEMICNAEKAGLTGESQIMDITRGDFSEGSKIIIENQSSVKDGNIICVDMPSLFEDSMSYGISAYGGTEKYCRKNKWEGAVEKFEMTIKGEVARVIKFEKNGTVVIVSEVKPQ